MGNWSTVRRRFNPCFHPTILLLFLCIQFYLAPIVFKKKRTCYYITTKWNAKWAFARKHDIFLPCELVRNIVFESRRVARTYVVVFDWQILLCVIFLTYMCCPWLCSHGGWFLLKCSAVGIGFNGAETNCGIARILGILLMNSCDR